MLVLGRPCENSIRSDRHKGPFGRSGHLAGLFQPCQYFGSLPQLDRGSGPMIEGDFDARTLANMNVALDRVCDSSPIGEQHELRKRVAQAIVRCAKSGKTALGVLTEAGERELRRIKTSA